jgi:hypothetical protein
VAAPEQQVTAVRAVWAWIKREPATVLLGYVAAGLGLVATWGLPWLTTTQAALVVAAINAVAAAVAAWKVRPITPAVFTGAAAAVVAVFAAYGLHVSQDVLGGINTALLAALTLLSRGQVSPVATAVPPTSTVSAATSTAGSTVAHNTPPVVTVDVPLADDTTPTGRHAADNPGDTR